MNTNLYYNAVFLAGIISFFSPCIIPVLPVYVGLLSDKKKTSKSIKIGKSRIYLYTILKSVAFVLGISTSFVILGFGAGFLSSFINGKYFNSIIGIIIILFGLHQTGIIKIQTLTKEKKVNIGRSYKSDVLGSFLLGFTFSFGWSPCIGPILGAILAFASSSTDYFYSVSMMFVYSLGLAVPFLIISIFSDFLLSRAYKMKNSLKTFKIIGGILIMFIGILMVFGELNLFTTFFQNLF